MGRVRVPVYEKIEHTAEEIAAGAPPVEYVKAKTTTAQGHEKTVYAYVDSKDLQEDGMTSVKNTNGATYANGDNKGESVPGFTYTDYDNGEHNVTLYLGSYSKPEPMEPVYITPSIHYYYTISDGYIYVAATTTGGGIASSARVGYANFKAIGATVSGSGVGSYTSSRESSKYPNNGKSGNYWYNFMISDLVDPRLVEVVDNDGILRPGIDTVTIKITESVASTLKTYGNVQYEYYVSFNSGVSWTLIQTTADTEIQYTIPANDENGNQIDLMIAGVKFRDNIGYIGDMVMTENLTLTNNMPPIISGIDTDWGELKSYRDDRPMLVYRVWDEDTEDVIETDEDGREVVKHVPTDIVTVVEYVDDIQTNQYQFKGITETLFSFPDSIWLTLLNGPHSIRIIATDDKDNSTTRTYTFIKAIDEISVTFEEPMESLEAMYLAVEEMVAELPTGSQLWVYVCNDGFDEYPTWQDATVEVRNGTKIYITNAGIWDGKEAAEMTPGYKWGYNVWVRIKRGDAEGPVYLTSVDGHWK